MGAGGGCVPVCTELRHCHTLLLSPGETGQHSGRLVIDRKQNDRTRATWPDRDVSESKAHLEE